jgi:ubiquinone/menaquinone biosynthesis C-methylase UbiE
MPTMYEIYDQYAQNYDELVCYEDYFHNLSSFINSIITGKTVLELGVGTGRVTELYIDRVERAVCVDRAQHMIDKAKVNLKDHTEKIRYECMDIRNLKQLTIKADCIVEGWTLGHIVIDEHKRLEECVRELMDDLCEKLNPGGSLIIIETLGTNTDRPHIPDEHLKRFYSILEETYHLKRNVVRTDYMFYSKDDAQRILSFFFGDPMKYEVNDRIVKEHTGVWVLRKEP